MARKRRRQKRGYPVAVLVGLEEGRAVLWRVFSEVVKLDRTVKCGEVERGDMYGFHDSIVDAFRPALKEGVRSVVIVAPERTHYASELLDHIRRHHRWLFREGPSGAAFGELVGSACQLHEVHELVKTKGFRDVVREITSREAENIAAALERSLESNNTGMVVVYSLEEIEDLLFGRRGQGSSTPEHVILTDKYLANPKIKGRILKLLQVSKNIGVKTKIVSAETRTGLRLTQFGGLVCLVKLERRKRP